MVCDWYTIFTVVMTGEKSGMTTTLSSVSYVIKTESTRSTE